MMRAVLFEDWACVSPGIDFDPTKTLVAQDSLQELTDAMNSPLLLPSLGCRGDNIESFLSSNYTALRDMWGIEHFNSDADLADPFNNYLIGLSI